MAALPIMAGASIVSWLFGKSSAKKAAKAQTQANQQALALQGRMYDTSRQDMMPWLNEGGAAIHQLGDMLQPGYDYTASPGYQFRLSEGMRGVENSAAAKGILQSTGTLRGIDRFNQNFAANDFNDQFQRVASVAAGGQSAASNLGQLGAGNASMGSAAYGNIGNARASGYAGQNAAVQGTLGNLMSLYNGGGFKGLGI